MNILCNVVAAGVISCQSVPYTPPLTVTEHEARRLCSIHFPGTDAACVLRYKKATWASDAELLIELTNATFDCISAGEKAGLTKETIGSGCIPPSSKTKQSRRKALQTVAKMRFQISCVELMRVGPKAREMLPDDLREKYQDIAQSCSELR